MPGPRAATPVLPCPALPLAPDPFVPATLETPGDPKLPPGDSGSPATPHGPSCPLSHEPGPSWCVPGMIVKRLPRKLDVMEGENAAFCVETREAVEGISWRRNGQELQESPCTVLKSFGKTHLLVLVHVTREDAGIVAFAVGDSETSAQFRVKCESLLRGGAGGSGEPGSALGWIGASTGNALGQSFPARGPGQSWRRYRGQALCLMGLRLPGPGLEPCPWEGSPSRPQPWASLPCSGDVSEQPPGVGVSGAKRVPPSTPVAACMSTEHSNAALLTWCPAPDVHRSPPNAYVLERQEAGTAEWVQCLTTDTAGAVEVLGDSVPAEADYRFRLCAVNKYGCSAHVEFPGAAHLGECRGHPPFPSALPQVLPGGAGHL